MDVTATERINCDAPSGTTLMAKTGAYLVIAERKCAVLVRRKFCLLLPPVFNACWTTILEAATKPDVIKGVAMSFWVINPKSIATVEGTTSIFVGQNCSAADNFLVTSFAQTSRSNILSSLWFSTIFLVTNLNFFSTDNSEFF